MKEIIRKNTGIIIIAAVIIIILVISEIPAAKKSILPAQTPSPQASQTITNSLPTVTATTFKEPTYTQPAVDTNGQINKNSVQVQKAISEKTKLAPQLPIYIEGLQTSVGINTTLNIYTVPEDPDYQIHIEIYGINYSDPNILQDGNANAQAFVESFNKVKALLNAGGTDIHNIYFVFGAKPYIQYAADNLIRKYGLL